VADARVFEAPFGRLPDLRSVDAARDIVFTWNGTTSGVRVPNGDWIAESRDGLAICDATSAAFAMALPWERLDAVAWSWQKVLGGEAAHGMLALSPRAVARLEAYTPAWPVPKVFQLKRGGKLNESIFRGDTINTPSLLCVEDALDALRWAEDIGGLPALVARTEGNCNALSAWVEQSDWVDFLAEDPATRSTTSVCLLVVDPWFVALSASAQAKAASAVVARLEAEHAAYDIGAYRDAPPGFRIWCGATVEQADIEALTPWLDWAWAAVRGAGGER
jgi:phosphoserine aminotransferase